MAKKNEKKSRFKLLSIVDMMSMPVESTVERHKREVRSAVNTLVAQLLDGDDGPAVRAEIIAARDALERAYRLMAAVLEKA